MDTERLETLATEHALPNNNPHTPDTALTLQSLADALANKATTIENEQAKK